MSLSEETPQAADRDGSGSIRLPLGEHSFGGGFLTLFYGGQRITAEFSAAKMEVIRLLNEKLKADIKDDLPPEAWGWRSPEILLKLMSNKLQEPETLRRTIWSINRTFRNAAARVVPGMQVPRLINTKRNLGIRLQWPFHVDSPEHGSPSSQPPPPPSLLGGTLTDQRRTLSLPRHHRACSVGR
jgi:hypothetical protein